MWVKKRKTKPVYSTVRQRRCLSVLLLISNYGKALRSSNMSLIQGVTEWSHRRIHDPEQDLSCWWSNIWPPSALLVNIYWQKLLHSLLVQLVALDSQLVPLESAEVQLVFLEGRLFWRVLDSRMCTALLPPQLGKLTALGTLPSTGTANRMLWWLTNAGKYPKEANHQPVYPINLMGPEFLYQQLTTTGCPISLQKQSTFGIYLWPFQGSVPW